MDVAVENRGSGNPSP